MLNFMEATGFVSSEDEFGVIADLLQTPSDADACSLRHPLMALIFDAWPPYQHDRREGEGRVKGSHHLWIVCYWF